MSNENYLKKLFIDEAKPALQRHSGGGGGSSDLIDCDSLPTSNIEEGKIYRQRWTETFETEASYTAYMYQPGAEPEPATGIPTVDTIDDATSLADNSVFLCKQDGKVYMISGGVTADFLQAQGFSPEEAAQLGLVDKSFAPDPSETRILIYTVYIPGRTVSVSHEKIAISPTENTEILKCINGELYAMGNAMKLLLESQLRPSCFYGNTDLTTLDGILTYSDTSNVTSMYQMFYNCSKLITVPLFDTSKVMNMNYMFNGCTSLTTVPLFDTSRVTNMAYMFCGCGSLTTVPLFDTSKVTSMSQMFSDCVSLTTVPLFDTSEVTAMHDMFRNCSKLTEVPLFDTSKVTDMRFMFHNCASLSTVPALDIRNITSVPSSMFYGCSSLTECWIKNIKTNLIVGSGTTYGHLLTIESLTYLIYELRDTGSSKTLTIGSNNITKLMGTYVKTVEITDEMRAEDDLVDEKLPFVVCKYDDEGSVLITDYVNAKNWKLA